MSAQRERIAELRIDRQQRERVSTPRTALLVIAVVLVAAAGVAFWLLRPPAAAAVRVATVVESGGSGPSTGATVLDASGYVVARLQATVSSKVTGKIVEVLVEEGMKIEEGQVLARLDDSIPSRQVALAEAQIASTRRALEESEVRLEEADINLRRIRELVKAAVSTDADLDAAEAQVKALAARVARGREDIIVGERQLALQRQQLTDTVIRAPFTGVAVTKNAQPGEMISPVSAGGGFTRTGICTLVDMSSLEIEVDVNEAYINRVEPDQRVVATLDAYQGWKIPASVITTVPTADRQKATVRVRIAFDELDPRILPDMGAKVSFLAEEEPLEVEGAITAPRTLIPVSAVVEEGETEVVFVLGGERAERRAVRLGSRQGDRVEVVAGLRAGETIVVEGAEGLADGDRVSVR